MRIARIRQGQDELFGVVLDEELVDLRSAFDNPIELLGASGDADGRDQIQAAAAAAPRVALAEAEFLPPIARPNRILCVGTNYADHVAESDSVTERPDHPMIFTRFASSFVGHGQALVRPHESSSFDYEGELAVIIGSRTRRATRETALAAIGGYSCLMDGTIRDWQRHTKQFTPGKNFEASGSWGPWIATADEIPDPYELELSTFLDGEQMQFASTTQLLFDIEDVIVYCSTFTTLEPGDVIATGTPGGVGYARDPQRLLTPGSEIVVEVPGVGRLTNPVTDES